MYCSRIQGLGFEVLCLGLQSLGPELGFKVVEILRTSHVEHLQPCTERLHSSSFSWFLSRILEGTHRPQSSSFLGFIF